MFPLEEQQGGSWGEGDMVKGAEGQEETGLQGWARAEPGSQEGAGMMAITLSP